MFGKNDTPAARTVKIKSNLNGKNHQYNQRKDVKEESNKQIKSVRLLGKILDIEKKLFSPPVVNIFK